MIASVRRGHDPGVRRGAAAEGDRQPDRGQHQQHLDAAEPQQRAAVRRGRPARPWTGGAPRRPRRAPAAPPPWPAPARRTRSRAARRAGSAPAAFSTPVTASASQQTRASRENRGNRGGQRRLPVRTAAGGRGEHRDQAADPHRRGQHVQRPGCRVARSCAPPPAEWPVSATGSGPSRASPNRHGTPAPGQHGPAADQHDHRDQRGQRPGGGRAQPRHQVEQQAGVEHVADRSAQPVGHGQRHQQHRRGRPARPRPRTRRAAPDSRRRRGSRNAAAAPGTRRAAPRRSSAPCTPRPPRAPPAARRW